MNLAQAKKLIVHGLAVPQIDFYDNANSLGNVVSSIAREGWLIAGHCKWPDTESKLIMKPDVYKDRRAMALKQISSAVNNFSESIVNARISDDRTAFKSFVKHTADAAEFFAKVAFEKIASGTSMKYPYSHKVDDIVQKIDRNLKHFDKEKAKWWQCDRGREFRDLLCAMNGYGHDDHQYEYVIFEPNDEVVTRAVNRLLATMQFAIREVEEVPGPGCLRQVAIEIAKPHRSKLLDLAKSLRQILEYLDLNESTFSAAGPVLAKSAKIACLLESAGSTYCAFGHLTFPARSCHKRRMANQSEFPNAMSADQFERMFPDDEACAEDLFRRRWPDGFVCPDCGSRNAVRLKRPRCVHQCRDCRKQTSVTAGTFMHRSHVPLKSWYRAIHIMTSHSNGMSALQLQHHLGLGSYKSAWMLVHKIRRAMDVADGFPLIVNVQADETSIPYRLKGSEPPPGGRSHEGRLMIAGAVEVFGENNPGCVKLRRIMDQSGPTLKAFLEDATDPGTWIVTDGWAGYDGLENHTAVVVGDTPAHEILDWIHRVFSNLKRWGLGVLHGFRCKHLDWQLVEWSFRWNWRQRRGESLFALLKAGIRSGPATWKDITATEA